MLTVEEITNIAHNYANRNKKQYYSLQLLFVKKSQFLDGYYDASFKVLNELGHEIEGPLMVAINEQNGDISSMEELIMQHSGDSKVKISNKPIKNYR